MNCKCSIKHNDPECFPKIGTCNCLTKGIECDMDHTQETWQERFDKEFVKDLGDDVEPIFLDPVGSVGPIKAFITQVREEATKEAYKKGADDAYEIIRDFDKTN